MFSCSAVGSREGSLEAARVIGNRRRDLTAVIPERDPLSWHETGALGIYLHPHRPADRIYDKVGRHAESLHSRRRLSGRFVITCHAGRDSKSGLEAALLVWRSRHYFSVIVSEGHPLVRQKASALGLYLHPHMPGGRIYDKVTNHTEGLYS